ncbi:fused DSP-PTPase phosphatase/NAD kinase-like protein [Luteolibacter sp. AS25]|uniref:protein-tyrosine phosphatase family protein n=1 Tax=Luteolibacter sp. AS25 TaxID=3135776 RepID=UPI00398A7619
MKPEHYPAKTGILYGGEYPGDTDPRIARERITYLVEAGIRTFIDLTAPIDFLDPYEHILEDLRQEKGLDLRRISIPIPDMNIPDSSETMAKILDHVHTAPPAIYVHCWGGIGRTGTVIGCWLRETGLGPDEALEQVQSLYSTNMPKSKRLPESPQTPSQKAYVREWSRRS